MTKGKTSFGPIWLLREMQRRGPGDYIMATPTFPLLELKALPEFRRLFETQLRLGKYVGSPSRQFVLNRQGQELLFGREAPARVLFGHAADPESLESATAKAAWLDEAGQKLFKLGSWEAIKRRLALHQGRALITTTPYNLGWLKMELWDRWQAGDGDIAVVRFDSTLNPAFPQAEFERARRELPGWKFDLFYRAIFTRPAGLIYDCFEEERDTCPRFAIPASWKRYLGLDFGPNNTAGMFYAEEPKSGTLYAYREYLAGGKMSSEHVRDLLAGEPRVPVCVGGNHSEQGWRDAFRTAQPQGLPVREPDQHEVEIGIQRVYGAHKRGEIVVFRDLSRYLEQKRTYSREMDEAGNATEAIEEKSRFHLLDAERYVIGWLKRSGGKMTTGQVDWQRPAYPEPPAGVVARSEAEVAAMLEEVGE